MLKARVITALFLLAGLLSAVFLLPAFGWLVFVSVVCGAAAAEWGGIVGFSVVRRRVYALLLGFICLAGGLVAGLNREETVAPFSLVPVYAVSALFWILCAPFWLRARWALSGSGASAIVGVVLLLPPSLAMAHLRLLSPWLLLGVMAAVWVADIAAYFTGRAFGRRKLAPSISPGKSWEGLLIGDKIVAVNKVSLTQETFDTDSIKKYIRGERGSTADLQIIRESKQLSISVIRGTIPVSSVDAAYMIDKTTGYIKLNKFTENSYEEFMQAMENLQKQGLQSLIYDLRGNGGGFMNEAVDMADEFLDGNKLIVYTAGVNNKKREYR